MALTRGELARKFVHMGVGSFAFLLRFLGPFWSAVLAAVALANNLFILPRIGGRRLWRESELATGSSIGIILYPLCVLLLILIFWQRLEVAAAAWGILAFGDGMASVAGMALGRRKLPWNPQKSWMGSGAYVLCGTLAAAGLLEWTAPGRYTWAFALAVGFAASLVAALLESIPQGLDDNLGVPLVSALFLFGLVLTQGHWFDYWETPGLRTRLLLAVAVNAALAAAAYALRTVDASGVIGGFFVGFMIWAFLDWKGFLLLLAFFVIGSACTKLGYKRKAAQNLAQEKGGRRGARHAFANAGVATACALFAALTDYQVLFALAFAASFATAAADTASSEIGQLLGRRTFLITTFRPVPRGTEGAVSVEGTLAGVLASLAVAVLGALLGLYPWIGVLAIVVAAFVGTTFESVVGAALEKRRLLDNEALNFLNTLVGALVVVVFTPWVVA
ncbi:MAG TPA: TIGR00297 family protein [Thermoanaerobaculia bacterium]|nr:TIGR00297 family protein [Thermoanaerobaculia bacterium]